jgi:hypothetical protein
MAAYPVLSAGLQRECMREDHLEAARSNWAFSQRLLGVLSRAA